VIELVVERNPGETRIAIREDGRTVEVRLDRLGAASRLGAIHLVRAVRIEPGIGAFLDLGERLPAFLPESGQPLVEGSALLVQTTKETVAGKGPEVTRALVLDGGALALTPFQPGIAVSRRLPDAMRKRLRARLKAAVGESGPGVLVRTSARDGDDLEAIWRDLAEQWREIEARAGETPPLRLWTPPDPLLLLIRQLRPDRLVAGDAATAAKLKSESVPVEKVDRPFEALGIEDELSRALAREVAIPGGRLLIEEGETLTAIDVNGAGDRLALCLAAAHAIGPLIRLRGLGGTLVVDFPFIDGKPDRERIDAALKASVDADPRPVDCLGWTRAGLYEMTRPRLGPSLSAQLRGSPVETAALAALRMLARAEGGRLKVSASPEVIAWLEGAGAVALAEAGRAVALEAKPGYAREQFDVVRE
jgi:ribonuclease G